MTTRHPYYPIVLVCPVDGHRTTHAVYKRLTRGIEVEPPFTTRDADEATNIIVMQGPCSEPGCDKLASSGVGLWEQTRV